jgi:hypothetical protein
MIISAKSKRTGEKVQLTFRSLAEARKHNPGLCDFEVIG